MYLDCRWGVEGASGKTSYSIFPSQTPATERSFAEAPDATREDNAIGWRSCPPRAAERFDDGDVAQEHARRIAASRCLLRGPPTSSSA